MNIPLQRFCHLVLVCSLVIKQRLSCSWLMIRVLGCGMQLQFKHLASALQYATAARPLLPVSCHQRGLHILQLSLLYPCHCSDQHRPCAQLVWWHHREWLPLNDSQSSCQGMLPQSLWDSSVCYLCHHSFFQQVLGILPSVLWRCWLGGRKGIRPVKNWVVGCWHGYLSGARCRLAYGPADATTTHCLLLQWNPDWFYLSGTGWPG